MATAHKSRVLDMTQGDPFRLVLQFSMPLFCSNLLQQLYNLTDTDEVIISNALLYLKISAPVIPPMAVLVILRNMLQGIRHTVEPLLASGLELVGKVIFAVWLVPVRGYRAVCFCEPTTWVVCFVFILLAVWRCRGDLRDAEKI